jgi:hypothetical protein
MYYYTLYSHYTPQMSTDCLVFRVAELDDGNSTPSYKTDTDIFILYDTYHLCYLLHGKRADTKSVVSKPYSFEAYEARHVLEFLGVIIPRTNVCTFELYSYPNLPINKNEITFGTLYNEMSTANELVAYTGQRIVSKLTEHILSSLQNIANDYPAPEEEEGDE